MHPGVAQCRNCWRWGHPTHACHAQGTKYQKCGSPHRVENHRLLAWCCKANTKSNPPREATAAGAPCPHIFKYLNCKRDHSADDNKCFFWRHCFDKQWHSNKAAEEHSGWANHSTVNGPSRGSFWVYNSYLFIEYLEELCAGWQSSGVPERLVWYSIHPGTSLKFYSICTFYFKPWWPGGRWYSYSSRINPGGPISTRLWADIQSNVFYSF